MIILDTNVLSALMQRQPDPVVVSWLNSVATESVWITSVTLFEIHLGLALLPEGKRRSLLETLFKELFEHDLNAKVLLFDQASAEYAAQLAAKRQHSGRTVDMRDTFIAGIALARKAILVTRNVRHFDDLNVPVLNPWTLS